MANTEIIPDTNPTQNPKLGYESVKKKRKRNRGKKEDEKLCSGEMNEKGESGGEEKEFVGTKEVEHDNEVEEDKKIKKKKVKSGSGIMSSVTFESMSLSEPTMKAIKDMGFHYTTEVFVIVLLDLKRSHLSVTDTIAMDCEIVGVSPLGNKCALGRATLG
ncbi:hypothetical protein ACET3Z_030453 [Daucus carota]